MDKKIRQAMMQTFISLLLVIVAVFTATFYFRSELMEYSTLIVGAIGVFGIALGIFMSDSLPAFLPVGFFLILAVAAGLQDLQVIVVCFFASISGGSAAYLSGRYLFTSVPFFKKRLPLYELKMGNWIRTHGKKAVMILSVTPVPYPWTAYTAGSFKMKYSDFLFASSFRLVRYSVYYYAIKLGWLAA